MASFWEKVKEFFAEDESWKQKEPITYQGKVYTAWVPEEDPYAVWPNAPCGGCKGIGLKKELYWNKETNTFFHKEHMK